MKKVNLIVALAAATLLGSCAQNDDLTNNSLSNEANVSSFANQQVDKDVLMKSFSSILSKAVYNNQKLREFIKTEALKKFDLNYEFLYYPNRNKIVDGNKTLRDILVASSSEKDIKTIEENLPLLNCLVADLPMTNVSPKDLDVKDAELPVALDNENGGTDLYLNGELVQHLASNEVPGFNVIVVNENRRVDVAPTSRADGERTYSFKYANFDNTNQAKSRAASNFDHSVKPDYLYKKAIAAYEAGFNKDDGSDNQMAYQRDYIYYGMTPTIHQGNLNRSITEYLSYMMVDKSVYRKIADQNIGQLNDDPMIRETSTNEKGHELTDDELYDRLWKRGEYTFIFEIASSKSSRVSRYPISISPRDLWNFNLIVDYRHKTMFRHSKYTYTIDPDRFTSKKYYFNPSDVTFGKWNIAEEGLIRYISIFEEDDKGATTTDEYKYEITRLNESQFKGDMKVSLGTQEKGKFDGEISGSNKTSTTTTQIYSFNIERKEGDDLLGLNIPIYFYDPIVVAKTTTTNNGGNNSGSSGGHFGNHRSASFDGSRGIKNNDSYTYKEYYTGSITFGIDVR